MERKDTGTEYYEEIRKGKNRNGEIRTVVLKKTATMEEKIRMK